MLDYTIRDRTWSFSVSRSLYIRNRNSLLYYSLLSDLSVLVRDPSKCSFRYVYSYLFVFLPVETCHHSVRSSVSPPRLFLFGPFNTPTFLKTRSDTSSLCSKPLPSIFFYYTFLSKFCTPNVHPTRRTFP